MEQCVVMCNGTTEAKYFVVKLKSQVKLCNAHERLAAIAVEGLQESLKPLL